MKYSVLSIVVVILVGFVFGITALVHYVKLDKGANGCLTKDAPAAGPAPSRKIRATELKVGETLDDANVCGMYVCQSTEGDALIHYCQRPAPFENCNTDGVSTATAFPECCWKCVTYVSCLKPTVPGASVGGGGEQDAPTGEGNKPPEGGTTTEEGEPTPATTPQDGGEPTKEGDPNAATAPNE